MRLQGKRIAILAEGCHTTPELWYPLLRMQEAGAEVVFVGMSGAKGLLSRFECQGGEDVAIAPAGEDSYDAVIVPNDYVPGHLRSYRNALRLVKSVFERGGVIATICDAGWVPISVGIVKDKRVTSVPEIKEALLKAGAQWVDQEVVRDGNLVTSREPEDLPAFCRAIIAALGESASR
jgi:protease I